MNQWKRAATLPVSFFSHDAETVGRGLLGAVLVTLFGGLRTAGRIVEVEAYLGASDPASHAYRFRHNRQNESIYGPPGSWYVYRSYGVHWCANLVTGPPGEGAAVLIRSLEPVEGLDIMRRRRGRVDDLMLCSGPGRLCQALGITRTLDGSAMRGGLALVKRGLGLSPSEVATTARIGITRAAEAPLRFVLRESRHLSRPLKQRR